MIGKFLVAVFLGFCGRMNDAYRYLMDKIIIVVREKNYFYSVVKLLRSCHTNEFLLYKRECEKIFVFIMT